MAFASSAPSPAPLTSALSLLRRFPPSDCGRSLAALVTLQPDLTDELLATVDQPLKVCYTNVGNPSEKPFLACDYNRDGDSYRSPWTNHYWPPIDGFVPTPMLRKMEIEANALWDAYRKVYFEGGYSSAYFFETGGESDFGATFLIHKEVDKQTAGMKSGWWDSIHVLEVIHENETYYRYKLTTTVMLSMQMDDQRTGPIDLSGSMTKQDEKVARVAEQEGLTHIAHMGVMMEDMELKIRNSIESIYVQKTREVLIGMRRTDMERQKQMEKVSFTINQALVTGHGVDR